MRGTSVALASPSLNAVVDSLHEVVRLLQKWMERGTLRALEMRRAIRKAHDAIAPLLDGDGPLSHLVASREEYGRSIESLHAFTFRFLNPESHIMKGAGVTKKTRRYLMRQLRNQRKHGHIEGDYRSDLRAHLRGALRLLDDLANNLEQPSADGKTKRETQARWRKVTYVLAGTAIVGLDTTVGAENPAISAMSATFGAAIVTHGVKGLE